MKKHNMAHLLALFATLAITGPAPAQATDPFVKKSVTGPPSGKATAGIQNLNPHLPRNILVTYEAFSVPIAEAPKLCGEGFTHRSVYTALTSKAEKHSAVLENYTSLVCQPGQRAISEAISEFTYPTEFTATTSDSESTEPTATPSLPSSFETKNLGFTLECECVISSGSSYVALTKKGAELLQKRLSPEAADVVDPFGAPAAENTENSALITEGLNQGDIKAVTYVETQLTPCSIEKVGDKSWGQGASEITVPIFDVENLKTGITLVSGEPSLIGTINPHPMSGKHKDGKRVWFAFITASVMTAGQ